MKMNNECFPCIARGALDAACLATDNEADQLKIVRMVLKELSGLDSDCPPPLMARFIQQTVETVTGVADPYGPLKDKYNAMAMDLYPWLKSLKDASSSRFDTSARLAVAGNIIDFGTASAVGRDRVMETITHALEAEVHGSIKALARAVKKAENILWLADNAGEIVFDKLMLEEMDCTKIIYAVRGGPVQNDVTMSDARDVGVTDMVQVIDSGTAIPGTLLDQCSGAFVEVFKRADLIISKGQGNFETLDHTDERIFFLFKAKCPVVARLGNCDMGDVVVRNFKDRKI